MVSATAGSSSTTRMQGFSPDAFAGCGVSDCILLVILLKITSLRHEQPHCPAERSSSRLFGELWGAGWMELEINPCKTREYLAHFGLQKSQGGEKSFMKKPFVLVA